MQWFRNIVEIVLPVSLIDIVFHIDIEKKMFSLPGIAVLDSSNSLSAAKHQSMFPRHHIHEYNRFLVTYLFLF